MGERAELCDEVGRYRRRFVGRHRYSASTLCTSWMQTEPSPTAEATRLVLCARTSPTANTPGRLVSNRKGERESGQLASSRSWGVRSEPALTKPLSSSATQRANH